MQELDDADGTYVFRILDDPDFWLICFL